MASCGSEQRPDTWQPQRRARSPGASARPGSLRLPFSSPLRLIVVLNEKLLEVMGDDVTQEQAFAHANDVLKNAVGGIGDTTPIPGFVNVNVNSTSKK